MKTVEERFWSKVKKTEGCWLWTASRCGNNGYGSFRIWNTKGGGFAHRYSYELHFGPIPKGMLVCHTCDNPICVRPDHLFIGTHKDNAIDREAKGRSHENGARRSSKLSANDVREIKFSTVSRRKLAITYGVSHATIAHIQNGKTWKHITKDSVEDFTVHGTGTSNNASNLTKLTESDIQDIQQQCNLHLIASKYNVSPWAVFNIVISRK